MTGFSAERLAPALGAILVVMGAAAMIDLPAFQLLLPFILVGFVAQMIDGALGMAFGTISNTLLLTLGVPPAAASAGVHTVESFTTAVSGISHAAHGNIDWPLFRRLVIPGVIGGVIGAKTLTMISAAAAKPLILAYLAAIGIYLLYRAFKKPLADRPPRLVAPLGLVGGFLDAAGGGGWGAIVTSNLLVQGSNPRKTIGTVSAAEFFLTVTISLAFLYNLGPAAFTQMTLGLLIGGVAAAPFGALVAKRIEAKLLLIMVGLVLTATSALSLWNALA